MLDSLVHFLGAGVFGFVISIGLMFALVVVHVLIMSSAISSVKSASRAREKHGHTGPHIVKSLVISAVLGLFIWPYFNKAYGDGSSEMSLSLYFAVVFFLLWFQTELSNIIVRQYRDSLSTLDKEAKHELALADFNDAVDKLDKKEQEALRSLAKRYSAR